MRTFEIVLIGFFILATVVAVGLFATYEGGGEENQVEPVSFTMWGQMDSQTFGEFMRESGIEDTGLIRINYAHVEREDLYDRLVEAVARGRGPDTLLYRHEQLARVSDFLIPLGPQTIAPRDYRSTFAEVSEVFMLPQGIYALPFTVDPMVMYWNRDLFANAGLVNPPQYWDEIPDIARRITLTDSARNIQRSAIAFGGARNTTHAKDILSLLIQQAGSPIVQLNEEGRLETVLRGTDDSVSTPAPAALGLYVQYANPINDLYSWNSTQNESRNAFVAQDLAIYFGYGSEFADIQRRNPNLNFDMAQVPQRRNSETEMTFADVYAFSLVRGASNTGRVYQALVRMTDAQSSQTITDITSFVPARRDLLAEGTTDQYQTILYDSAILADVWLDPNPAVTNEIFVSMVEDAVSGRRTVREAVGRAQDRLNQAVGEVQLTEE